MPVLDIQILLKKFFWLISVSFLNSLIFLYMIMPAKLPDFIENRLFLILYFVCAKNLGLKIFLSHDSKCATSDIIVHREIHIYKNGCFYSFSVNIILQPRSFRIWFKSFWTQRYVHNICKLVTNNRRFCLQFLFYRNTHIDTR